MVEGFNGKDRDLLVRLEERSRQMELQIAKMVTKDAFYPVKLISYGLAGGALLTVLGGLLATVLIP